jgi:hypothetical protein
MQKFAKFKNLSIMEYGNEKNDSRKLKIQFIE